MVVQGRLHRGVRFLCGFLGLVVVGFLFIASIFAVRSVAAQPTIIPPTQRIPTTKTLKPQAPNAPIP